MMIALLLDVRHEREEVDVSEWRKRECFALRGSNIIFFDIAADSDWVVLLFLSIFIMPPF